MLNPICFENIDLLIQDFEYKDGELFFKKTGEILQKQKESRGYWNVRINGKIVKHHRLIYAIVNKQSFFGNIDHINGLRRDNRIENLRCASNQENTFNRKIHSNNALGVKGIRKIGDKYQARIMFYGKTVSSTHCTLNDAQEWIQEKRVFLHKLFANNG